VPGPFTGAHDEPQPGALAVVDRRRLEAHPESTGG
jgi:hypothetical protein